MGNEGKKEGKLYDKGRASKRNERSVWHNKSIIICQKPYTYAAWKPQVGGNGIKTASL